MSDFAIFFLPFVTKACTIGLYRRGHKIGVIGVLLTIVCYGLYAINIMKLALCVASVGMIIVLLKRLQKDYSDF